jgi:hypothetical protein
LILSSVLKTSIEKNMEVRGGKDRGRRSMPQTPEEALESGV